MVELGVGCSMYAWAQVWGYVVTSFMGRDCLLGVGKVPAACIGASDVDGFPCLWALACSMFRWSRSGWVLGGSGAGRNIGWACSMEPRVWTE